MRRSILVGVSSLLAVGLCGLVLTFHLWQEPPGITRANYDKIEAGMTKAEVEAILGCPPGNFGADVEPVATVQTGAMFRSCWIGNNAVISVTFTFGPVRRVAQKHYGELRRGQFLDRLRALVTW
jgi:hypothetical protein